MTSLAAPSATPAPRLSTPRFVRSIGEFRTMVGEAYRVGTAYRHAREPHGRQRVLEDFVTDLQQRSA